MKRPKCERVRIGITKRANLGGRLQASAARYARRRRVSWYLVADTQGWCGEHPDFPWIAATRSAPPSPDQGECARE